MTDTTKNCSKYNLGNSFGCACGGGHCAVDRERYAATATGRSDEIRQNPSPVSPAQPNAVAQRLRELAGERASLSQMNVERGVLREAADEIDRLAAPIEQSENGGVRKDDNPAKPQSEHTFASLHSAITNAVDYML